MPMWRCPHCATPQPEASRCWVCQRSSTCCATCRHFRRSIAAQLGYCGLDRGREPLDGTAIRACWESVAAGGQAAPTAPQSVPAEASSRTPVRSGREFVAVDESPGARRQLVVGGPGADTAPVLSGTAAGVETGRGWTLFPELEG